MSIATYRGVKYDTTNAKPKSKYWKAFLGENHFDGFKYRGLEYKGEELKDV